MVASACFASIVGNHYYPTFILSFKKSNFNTEAKLQINLSNCQMHNEATGTFITFIE